MATREISMILLMRSCSTMSAVSFGVSGMCVTVTDLGLFGEGEHLDLILNDDAGRFQIVSRLL